MKQRIAALAVAIGVLGFVFVAPAAAAPPVQSNVTHNGAGGLVAAVVDVISQVQAKDAQVGLVNLNNSLNNLTALNNVLSHNNIPITVQNISVLDNSQIDILRQALQNANIQIGQVVGVGVLSGGQLIAFTR